ncbi:MAG: hypothetical protein FD167_566 [bacterium]|nr:MAG: hypothetical protein FD167_566 [bacterium]
MTLSINNLSLTNTAIYAQQSDEEIVIKLDKRLQYNNVSEAKAELTSQLLTPPINLGAKRDEVKRKLGIPKEIYGFGTEFYKIKNANLTISYTTDETGEVVVSNLEFRPDKEILWVNWLKPVVKLPSPPADYDKKSKTPIRITTQVRISDVGNNKSWQITLIGSQTAVTYVSWNIVL